MRSMTLSVQRVPSFCCRRLLKFVARVLALGMVMTGGPAAAQEVADALKLTAVRNDRPAFLARVDVNHETREYRQGDALKVTATAEVDAYLYILYQQADGKTFQIFPNRAQANNRIAARQPVQFPAEDDTFRWKISPPFGKEVVKVIAAQQPIAELSDPALRAKSFNPVTGVQWSMIKENLAAEPANVWTEHDVDIFTRPKTDATLPPGARRFGLFIGVSEYQFNAEAKLAAEDKRELNLRGCHQDARALAKVLGEVGAMNEVRVLVNEQATRANIYHALAEWLPGVSRPGDTVVVFFSGHGMQVPDDNGDEPDGMDELLTTHDIVTPGIFLQLLEKSKRGEPVDPRLRSWVQMVVDAQDDQGIILMRSTGITDDEFGHLMQRLDGRQTIVILDACHSAGMSAREKGDGKDPPFEYLDKELVRLKDLGQRESVLLSACLAAQAAMVRIDTDHGVLTAEILDLLRTRPGPIDMPSVHEYCVAKIPDYFAAVNSALAQHGLAPLKPHDPFFMNTCTKPAYLKP